MRSLASNCLSSSSSNKTALIFRTTWLTASLKSSLRARLSSICHKRRFSSRICSMTYSECPNFWLISGMDRPCARCLAARTMTLSNGQATSCDMATRRGQTHSPSRSSALHSQRLQQIRSLWGLSNNSGKFFGKIRPSARISRQQNVFELERHYDFAHRTWRSVLDFPALADLIGSIFENVTDAG